MGEGLGDSMCSTWKGKKKKRGKKNKPRVRDAVSSREDDIFM